MCIRDSSCADLLDSCRFSEFWTEYKTLGDDVGLKKLASTSEEKIRQGIVNVLALSYRSAPASVVSAALNLTDSAAVAKYDGIESASKDKVMFVETADNTKRGRVFQDSVDFSAISSLMSKASVTSQ